MTQNWPAGLRDRLEKQKAELTERIDRIKADIGRGLDADSKEQAGQLENREVLDALANEGVNELAEINSALRRMNEGTYGVCTECGARIDARRLEARPYSVQCIGCASS